MAAQAQGVALCSDAHEKGPGHPPENIYTYACAPHGGSENARAM